MQYQNKTLKNCVSVLTAATLALALASLPACKSGAADPGKQVGVSAPGASETAVVVADPPQVPAGTATQTAAESASPPVEAVAKPVAISAFTQGDVSTPVQIGGTNLTDAADVTYQILIKDAGGAWIWGESTAVTIEANGAARVLVPAGVYVLFSRGDFRTVAPAVSPTRLGTGSLEMAVNFDAQSTVAASFFEFLVSLSLQVTVIDLGIQNGDIPLNDAYRLAVAQPNAEQLKILKQRYFEGALVVLGEVQKLSREEADKFDLGGAFFRADPKLHAALAAGTFVPAEFAIDLAYQQQANLAAAGGDVTISGVFEIVLSGAASDQEVIETLGTFFDTAFKQILTGLGVAATDQKPFVDRLLTTLGTAEGGGVFVSLPQRLEAPAPGAAPPAPSAIEQQFFNQDRVAQSVKNTQLSIATGAEFTAVVAEAVANAPTPVVIEGPSGPTGHTGASGPTGHGGDGVGVTPQNNDLPPATPPAAPTGLVVASHSATIITWTWAAASGVQHYVATLLDENDNVLGQQAVNPMPTLGLALPPPPSAPSATFAELASGATYKISVQAYDSAGTSSTPTVATSTTDALGAATMLAVNPVHPMSGGGFVATWHDSVGADAGVTYRIYWAVSPIVDVMGLPYFDFSKAMHIDNATAIPLFVMDANPNATFYFQIRAVNLATGVETVPEGFHAATASGQLLH